MKPPALPRVPLRHRIVATLAALAGVVVLAGCDKAAAPPAPPPPQVSVQTIEPQTIPFAPTFVAQTESSRQVNIVARVSGFLEKIAYHEGALVREGDLMFALDRKPLVAQLDAAQGELQSQQARLATAEADLKRVKPLAEQDRAAAGRTRPRPG